MSGLSIDVAAWSGPWRYRSPGDKLLLCFGLMLCALLLPVWPGCLIVTVVSIGLALGPAGIRARVLARASRGALLFVLIGGLGLIVSWQPETRFGLTVTAAGLAQAGQATAHAIAGTSAMLLLAVTTPICDLLDWARRRGVPDPVVEVAGLIYRLLFVLLATIAAIRASQISRLGYATRRAALRSAAMLSAAVLIRAWDRARRLEEGLAGRGFDGSLRVLADPRPSSPRFVAASSGVLIGVVLVSLVAGPAQEVMG